MQGLMMNTPLLISSIAEHGAKFHGGREIVSVTADNPRHRYSYRECFARAKQLANALRTMGLEQGDRQALHLGRQDEGVAVAEELFHYLVTDPTEKDDLVPGVALDPFDVLVGVAGAPGERQFLGLGQRPERLEQGVDPFLR